MDNDDLDLASAIWILASNDETHLITYEGIRHRLSLPKEFDVRGLIKRRPELFRPGANARTLDEWKVKLRDGKSLPSWIRELPDETRLRTIENLSADDVFRSQFRAHRESPRSPIEIISWGLQHLDRLRKAKLEAKEATAKSWQMWLVFIIGVINIVVSIVLTFMSKSGVHPCA
jgi:hypothetical protein